MVCHIGRVQELFSLTNDLSSISQNCIMKNLLKSSLLFILLVEFVLTGPWNPLFYLKSSTMVFTNSNALILGVKNRFWVILKRPWCFLFIPKSLSLWPGNTICIIAIIYCFIVISSRAWYVCLNSKTFSFVFPNHKRFMLKSGYFRIIV